LSYTSADRKPWRVAEYSNRESSHKADPRILVSSEKKVDFGLCGEPSRRGDPESPKTRTPPVSVETGHDVSSNRADFLNPGNFDTPTFGNSAELLQSAHFNLANTFFGDAKSLANLFESLGFRVLVEPESA